MVENPKPLLRKEYTSPTATDPMTEVQRIAIEAITKNKNLRYNAIAAKALQIDVKDVPQIDNLKFGQAVDIIRCLNQTGKLG